MKRHRIDAQREASTLEEPVREANELARKLGLDPYPVNYWVVNYDEMNALIAYGGFQTRYPHWRWGMTYDRQKKKDQFGMGKAFEIVNNDNPSHAFLQESNSTADQKAVITHVEAHADFFRNNEWFGLFGGDDELDAAAMLERHAETISGYMNDPEVDREDVESFIDAVLCLEDTIDQHRALADAGGGATDHEVADVSQRLDDMDISDDVRRQVFDDAFVEQMSAEEESDGLLATPQKDVLAYLREYGMQYDEEAEKAVEMEPWQKDVLDMLRTESYYFAPQKMTKVMNEGWAAYWESLMMGEEGFARDDEFITYADHQARVLGSPGLNPYKLGKELWEYIENTTNRREVADKLLRVEGISWRNFHDAVDFGAVQERLQPHPAMVSVHSDSLEDLLELGPGDPRVDHETLDRARSGETDEDGAPLVDAAAYPWKVLTYEGLAERHFSLVKPQNRGFLRRINRSELERLSRYMFDDAKYDSVETALSDVDYAAGWDRMREIRESHNDVTFLDAFLSQEFVTDNNYFTYEYTQANGDFRATSSSYEDVKKKLLLQFTNFGKPTVAVYDGNFENRNELLLGHQYNGIMLDLGQAKEVLRRTYDLWGHPVNLMTIVKEYDEHDVEVARRRNREPEPAEVGKRIRFDGESFEAFDLSDDLTERIAAADVDYDTKPDEWLA